jgi:hypothetical protein
MTNLECPEPFQYHMLFFSLWIQVSCMQIIMYIMKSLLVRWIASLKEFGKFLQEMKYENA